eukprot:5624198-Prymnesium_polylepis.3
MEPDPDGRLVRRPETRCSADLTSFATKGQISTYLRQFLRLDHVASRYDLTTYILTSRICLMIMRIEHCRVIHERLAAASPSIAIAHRDFWYITAIGIVRTRTNARGAFNRSGPRLRRA